MISSQGSCADGKDMASVVRPIQDVRKSILVNHVGPEWRARHELCFSNQGAGICPAQPRGDPTAEMAKRHTAGA
jgi:hypothetical protein